MSGGIRNHGNAAQRETPQQCQTGHDPCAQPTWVRLGATRDEDNIDLNRNFVDHSSAYPGNPLYADLAKLVTPGSWTDTTPEEIANGFRNFKQQHGISAIEVFSKGQYTHPDGFFFRGNARAWSNEMLTSIATQQLAAAEHIYDIDIHTGLGPFAKAEYIVECIPDSPQYLQSQAIWGDRLRSTATGASRSASVSGSTVSGLKTILGDRLAGIGLEFFCPDSADWRQTNTATARLVVQQALDYAAR